ncbi:hypothetical protein EG347_09515 [Chryseobacterium sp. G0186]|uniref:hypothetical protein n=1 Tax=Chryseobacterium sp. G0186 TaxID=2487064 RepID=UPI000F4F6F9C|nr:hypothetical protein [Chryseobacterium sp. G0186]AZA77740.1 hypothetical protein EG347_09515 [Chryseobacterium sp. G0186]
MERNIAIYMFDREKAAKNLYRDLQHRMYHTQTFKGHMAERVSHTQNDTISIDRILESIQNDVNMMSPDDLYEITHFFSSQIHPLFAHDTLESREEYIKTLYDYLGITRLYELNTTKAGKAYAYLYEIYTDSFPIEGIRGKHFSANIRSEDFLRFNDFVILLTKRIIESALYEYHDELSEQEEIIIEAIRSENLHNELLSEAIEDQMKFLINVFFPDDRQDFIQAVYHALTFLQHAIRMRSEIDVQKNPRIILVDIY